MSSTRIVELLPASLAVRCRAGDGSEWYVATNQYGTRFGWADTLRAAMAEAGTLAPVNSASQQTGEYPR